MSERKLLSEFTTEELRKELRKRRRKPRPSIPKWLTWKGKVIGAHEWGTFRQYKYTVETDDPRVPEKERTQTVTLKRGTTKKKDRPRVGDEVILYIRYTRNMETGKSPIWWNTGKIKKVIPKPQVSL